MLKRGNQLWLLALILLWGVACARQTDLQEPIDLAAIGKQLYVLDRSADIYVYDIEHEE